MYRTYPAAARQARLESLHIGARSAMCVFCNFAVNELDETTGDLIEIEPETYDISQRPLDWDGGYTLVAMFHEGKEV